MTNSATLGQVAHTGTGNCDRRHRRSPCRSPAQTARSSSASPGSTTYAQIATAINNITSTTGVTASASGSSNLTFKSDQLRLQPVCQRRVDQRLVRHHRRNQRQGVRHRRQGARQRRRRQRPGTERHLPRQQPGRRSHAHHCPQRRQDQDVRHHRRRGDLLARLKGHRQRQGEHRHSVGVHRQPGRRDHRVPQLTGQRRRQLADQHQPGHRPEDRRTKPSPRSATLRGRLGAFQKYTLGSTINSLGVAYENVSAADSAITDTDFASETANLTRSQILSSAATTVLSQANAAPQSVLNLLH